VRIKPKTSKKKPLKKEILKITQTSNNEAPAVLLLLFSNEASLLVFSSFFYDVGLFLLMFFLFLSI
jgi:hypothetical protein